MARLGALDLGAVTVDGARVKPTIDDQTIIVPLGGVLPDGATATIVVPFSARLRSTLTGSNWLFTRANGIVDMHRWIPWVSRKRRFDRPNHGDPFVTPVSDRVTVRIRTDTPLRFGTTGHGVTASNDGLTRTFEATHVRDFVVTAAADYGTLKRQVGNTEVRVISRPGFAAARALDAAANAVRKLEAKLGPYPYPTLRVVQSAGAYGMEGPGIAWIPTGTPSGNLTYLVTHEIAHQWFYGIVGNDQAREPFADEAATDFVARRVLGLRRGVAVRDRRPRPVDLPLLVRLLLRGRLHPGRQPARQCAPEDGIEVVLGGDARLRRRPSLGPQPHANAARCAGRGHAAEPAPDVAPSIPEPVLTMAPITVRLASIADGAACAAIYGPFVATTSISFELTPPTADEMAARIAKATERTPWLVAEVDGIVRGYAYGTRHRDRAAYDWTVESAVYVDGGFAGRGIGRAAMTALVDVLRLQGFHLVVAGITQPNPASTALHVALGFERIGQFDAIGWKQGRWHGVEWYGLELGPRDQPPTPIRPLADAIADWEARRR